ncbi:MAG: hypothetical protein HQL10_10505 [Nitrospirae bacterium]|nr:hypothetical protein [Nitrospirota bacterium]
MKFKIYLVYGIIISSLFFAAGLKGYVISSMTQPTKWGPQGSHYHK